MPIRLTWIPPVDNGGGVIAYKIYKRTTPGVITSADFFLVLAGNILTYDDYFYTRRHLEDVGYYYKVTALTDQVESDLSASNLVHVLYSFEDQIGFEPWEFVFTGTDLLQLFETWDTSLPSTPILLYEEHWDVLLQEWIEHWEYSQGFSNSQNWIEHWEPTFVPSGSSAWLEHWES